MMNWEGMGGWLGWVGGWVVGWWDLDDRDERTYLLLPYLYLARYNFRIYQFIHDARCLVCLSRLLVSAVVGHRGRDGQRKER